MRPIPATRLGDAHGLLRAIEKRGRLRTDEFVTEFNLDELFPPDLENALGRMRHFISFCRLAGLVKEDRGVVELTDLGKRYMRSGDDAAPYDISSSQAEWLRRQLREKHMTDSIFHGLAIGLSLLASVPPGTRISTMDFGRAMAYLGRAGWDNENTLRIQGERHIILLTDLELIRDDHSLTPVGEQLRLELTLPVHMSLVDLAAQLNPGGIEAVRAAAEEEFAAPAPEPEPEPEPPTVEAAEAPEPEDDDNGYHTVMSPAPARPATPPPADIAPPTQGPPSTPPPPPIVPRGGTLPTPAPDRQQTDDPLLRFAAREPATPPPPGALSPGDPMAPGPGGPAGLTPGDPLAAGSVPPPAPSSYVPTDTPVAPPSVPAPPDESIESAASHADTPATSESFAPPSEPAPSYAETPAASESFAPPSEPAPDRGEAPAASESFAPPSEPAPDRAEMPAASESFAPPSEPAPSAADVPPIEAAPDRAESPAASESFAPPSEPAPSSADVPPVESAPDRAEMPAAGEPFAPPSEPAPSAADVPPVEVAPDRAETAAASESFAPPSEPAPSSADVPPVESAPSAAVTPPVEFAPSGAGVSAARPVDPVADEPAPVESAPREPSVAPPPVSVAPPRTSTPTGPLPPVAVPSDGRFVDAATIRAAAVAAGLRLPQSVYANAAAGLATGKHLILTGPPGSGKTTLAMAIARAAAQTGHAHGATVVTAEHRWAPKELLLAAAAQGRWVIADELHRARPDRALGALSTFLMGIPVATDQAAEAEAADGWRIVATWGGGRPHASPPLLRRFAFVEVLAPAADELHSALQQAANHDATATRAAERLLGLNEITPLGAGVFLDAARHAAARNEATPADDLTLAREAFTAYVEPLLGDLDDEQQSRVQQLLGTA